MLPLKYLLQYAEESGLQDLLKMELSQEEEYTAFLKASMGKSLEVKEGLSRFVEKYFLWGTKKLIGLQMLGM